MHVSVQWTRIRTHKKQNEQHFLSYSVRLYAVAYVFLQHSKVHLCLLFNNYPVSNYMNQLPSA